MDDQSLNKIAKIGYGYMCLRKIGLILNNFN
jgi:hypothetical protein